MTRGVSYQSMLGEPGRAPAGVYVRLGESAIATRRKAARRDLTVTVSKPQSRWLRDAVDLSGSGIDESAIVRALVDLGMELEIDWAVLATGTGLRAAVRESVMVRRQADG